MAKPIVRAVGQKVLEAGALLPARIRGALPGNRLNWSASDEAAIPVARPGKTRLLIGPANFAGQGYEWARAADLIPGVSAVNVERIGGNGVSGFAADFGVRPDIADFSPLWARRQRRALSGFTHVLIESGIPLYSAGRREKLADHVRDLQALGLEVGLLWHGSDVRQPEVHGRIEKYSPFNEDGVLLPIYSTTRWAHRAANELDVPEFVSTPDLLRYRPNAAWLPTVVNPDDYLPEVGGLVPSVPVVLHAPSKALLKGTQYVREAASKLQDEGLIEYREVSGVTREQLQELIRQSDIVVDSLALGMYGVVSVEAMLLEKVAVANVWESAREYILSSTGQVVPVAQADPSSIERVLRELAVDPELRTEIAELGRPFASSVHSRSRAATVLAPVLEGGPHKASPEDTMSRSPRMVFHAPFPVGPGATSASGIRPWKMLQAFKSAGFEVFEVTGYAAERRRRFASLKRGVAAGWKPDFVYSEAATIPSSFTEPRHFPLILNLEREFFRFVHDAGIPSGVFYRDVYWAFEDYERGVGKPVARAMRALYGREIKTFNRYVDVVFLPSLAMGAHIPGLNGPKLVALPPGADIEASVPEKSSVERELRIFYVGGVGGEHYDISALIEGVEKSENCQLVIATRPDGVENANREYGDLIGDSTKFVQASGAELNAYYDDCDVASLVMRPQEYREFAAPMKLYEYLGHGKPIVVSSGTLAADVVEQSEAGWVVGFEADQIARLLAHLRDQPSEVVAKAANAAKAGLLNTWEERAKFAAQTLRETQR